MTRQTMTKDQRILELGYACSLALGALQGVLLSDGEYRKEGLEQVIADLRRVLSKTEASDAGE